MLRSCLLLVLEVCNVKQTCRKSLARNLLMGSDLILGPSRSNEGSLALEFFPVDTILHQFANA